MPQDGIKYLTRDLIRDVIRSCD